jgi:hypothetical protein
MSTQKESPFATGYFSQGWETKLILALVMLFLGMATVYWYFKPAYEPNKVLMQSDILQGTAMSKEIVDFRKATKGEEPLWTNRMFGGMPAYQISTTYKGNLIGRLDSVLRLDFLFPYPIGVMFLLFLGMFILLSVLKVEPVTAAMGSMAFLMSSYFFIALEAGHNSKLNALAYVPMLLSGVILTYRGRFFLGGAMTALFLSLSIHTNHVQMTYYGMFIVIAAVISIVASAFWWPNRVAMLALLLAIPACWRLDLPSGVWKGFAVTALLAPLVSEFFIQGRSGTFKNGIWSFIKGTGALDEKASKFRNVLLASVVFAVAGVLAIGPNAGRIWTNQDYVKDTMRGGVVLKRNLQGSNTDGLNPEYAYQWSYGRAESFTLINPYYYGGASSMNIGKDSETYDVLKTSLGPQAADALTANWPTYLGDQPFTSGPVFVGSVVCFLFILGLVVVPDRYRWWLLVPTILGIMLSWGRNYQAFSDLFFYHAPLYNKFRAVSSMLVIAEITMPVLATLAAVFYIKNPSKRSPKEQLVRLGIATGVTLLLLLVLVVAAPGTGGYALPEGEDAATISRLLARVGLKNPDAGLIAQLTEATIDDRAAFSNSWNYAAMLFTLLSAGLLFVADRYIRPMLPKAGQMRYLQGIVGAGLLVLVLVEMIPLNKRYLSEDNFVPKSDMLRPFTLTAADNSILADKDPDFRVINLTKDPWSDAMTSYYHKNIGGYHPAKFRRYNDLITHTFTKEIQALSSAFGVQGPERMAAVDAEMKKLSTLNMLNCKYFIINPSGPALPNPYRRGNAWVVEKAQVATASSSAETDADVALDLLSTADLGKTMIVEKEFEDKLQGFAPNLDTLANVLLLSYQPNALSYKFSAPSGKEQLVVFSEIYYGNGWNAYIDNQPAPHFRCNYVLRGMRVPGGNHTIDFKFEPVAYAQGEALGYSLSILLLLVIAGAVFLDFRQQSKRVPGASDEESELI